MAGHSIGGFQTPQFIIVTAWSGGQRILPTDRILEVGDARGNAIIWLRDQPSKYFNVRETIQEVMNKLVVWSSH